MMEAMSQAEFDFYAASSGAGATATLNEHQAAYWAAQGPVAPAGLSQNEIEAAFYRAKLADDTPDETLEGLRLRYFASISGLPAGNSVRDHMAAVFGGVLPPPDVTNPTPGTLASSGITDTAFTLTVSGASDETALHASPYAFSTDNGSSWSAYQTSPIFNVTGKVASTGHTCLHRTRDAAGNVATGSSILVTTTAAAAPLVGTYLTELKSIADASSYTFPAVDLGVASATRRIVVGMASRQTTSVTISSVTVGGVALAKDVGSWTLQTAEIWSGVVPSGTTGDIVITYSAVVTHCGVGVWHLTKGAPVPALGFTTQMSGGSVGDIQNLDVGDFAVAVVAFRTTLTAGPQATWGGMAERYDGAVDAAVREHTGADLAVPAVGGLKDLSATIAGGSEGLYAMMVYRA